MDRCPRGAGLSGGQSGAQGQGLSQGREDGEQVEETRRGGIPGFKATPWSTVRSCHLTDDLAT